jgi:hypothetical protein
MSRRRRNEGASISLVPILSIQKCAMGVMVVIICAQTTVTIARTAAEAGDQYLEVSGTVQDREAVFVECQAKEILIHPAQTAVSLETLKGPGPSPFTQLLDELQTNRDKQYLVLLIRPDGIATYDRCLRMALVERKLEVGKDALLEGGKVVLTKEGKPLLKKAVP